MGLISHDKENGRIKMTVDIEDIIALPHLEDNGTSLVDVNENIGSVIARALWNILNTKGKPKIKDLPPFKMQRVHIEDDQICVSFYYDLPEMPPGMEGVEGEGEVVS